MLVVECKQDTTQPPAEKSPTVEQGVQLLEAGSTAPPDEPQPPAESTIVAQLPAAEVYSHAAVAPSVEHTELFVVRPPGELLAADIAQQAVDIAVEQNVSVPVPEMLGLQTASAADAASGEERLDSDVCVDHLEWMTRVPARRCVMRRSLCFGSFSVNAENVES